MAVGQSSGNFWIIDDDPVFDTGEELTLSAWIKWYSVSGAVLCHDVSDYKYLFYNASIHNMYVRMNSGNLVAASGGGVPLANVWRHWLMRFDSNAGSNELEFWLDGSRIATGTLLAGDKGTIIKPGDEGLKSKWGTASNADYAEVALFNVAISDVDITRLYAGGSRVNRTPLTIPGLVGYWDMMYGPDGETFGAGDTGILHNRVAGGPHGQAFTGDICTHLADPISILGAGPLIVQTEEEEEPPPGGVTVPWHLFQRGAA